VVLASSRTTRLVATAATAVMAFSVVLALPAVAAAQAGYTPPAVTPGSPTPGAGGTNSVPVTMTGCAPSSAVSFTSGGGTVGSATAGATGSASTTATIPAGVTGSVTITGSCTSVAGATVTASTVVTIPGGGSADPSGGSDLAFTGSDSSSVMVRIGAVVLVLGVALVLAVRSRRNDRVDA